MRSHWAFSEFFVTPLLRITIFRSHTPLEFYLIFFIFHHTPPPPPSSPRNPRKSVILNYDPLEFSNFKHNRLEFSRFSFLRPPWNFRYPQQGGSGKFLEKPIVHSIIFFRSTNKTERLDLFDKSAIFFFLIKPWKKN